MEEGSLFYTCSPEFIDCRFFDDGHSDFSPLGFPQRSVGKESACNAGDPGSIPGLGRSSGEGNGNPLQYFLPGKSHGQRSLVGYSSWGHKESDTTE